MSHLVCLVSIVAFRWDFGKSSESAGLPGFVQMAEDQVEELFGPRLTAKDFNILMCRWTSLASRSHWLVV